MAPLIGKEMTESVFLDRFASLCVDPLFHVRKVCAANFGDFANVVGCEPTENVLVRYIPGNRPTQSHESIDSVTLYLTY